MSRLPVPGDDNGVWGEILNDFLLQSLDENGQLRPGIITDGKLSSSIQTSLSKASTSVQTVNGIAPINGNITVAAGAEGPVGPAGANGQSITVTLVSEANWPPPSDPDPLHWYIKVP